MSKNIKKLVIDRALWGSASLLRRDGRMCCLGHLGKACGVPDEAMFNVGTPDGLLKIESNKYPRKFDNTRWANYNDFGVVDIATEINDSNKSLKEKEYRLKILFKAHGINLSFKGKSEVKKCDF